MQRPLNKVIILLEIFCFVISKGEKLKINIFSIAFALLFALNGVLIGTGETYKSNLLMLLYPFLNVTFISYYSNKYEDTLIEMLRKICIPLNTYMWINIFVMFIQMQGNYFMVGFSDWENPAYWDLIAGLFGYSTTHVVCMFSTFVIIYDVVELRLLRGIPKICMKGNLIALIAVMLWLSVVNDNAAFYIVMPSILVCWILYSNNLKKISKLQKIMIGTLLFIIVGVVAYTLVPGLSVILYDAFFYKVAGALELAKSGTSITHGSMERIAQIIFGLNYLNGWKVGCGFDKAGLFSDGAFGFAHFGNASAGGLVCLGGIWSWALLCLAYAETVSNMGYKKRKCIIFVFPIITLFSIYTTLFTDVSIALAAFLIVLPFWYAEKMKIIDKETNYG